MNELADNPKDESAAALVARRRDEGARRWPMSALARPEDFPSVLPRHPKYRRYIAFREMLVFNMRPGS